MIEFCIEGIGAIGPGFDNWDDLRAVLRGDAVWSNAPTQIPQPPILSPTEKRRASATVRIALQVGLDASQLADLEPAKLPVVFASCHGEVATTHRLMVAINEPEPLVSPTLFHNSVHNTPAGYWSISVHSQEPTSSISGGWSTPAAGLLKAANLVRLREQSVLLVFYDAPFPEPMYTASPYIGPLGIALVVRPVSSRRSYGHVSLAFAPETMSADMPSDRPAIVEEFAQRCPIGDTLVLLHHVAVAQRGEISSAIEGWSNIQIKYTP